MKKNFRGTLRSMDCVESMISIARTHSSEVKNWQNGTMALRWCAVGRIEAGKQFRRVNATCTCPRSAPPSMRKAPRIVGTVRHDEPVLAA